MPRSVKIPLWPWNQKFLETPLIIEPVHTSEPHAQGTDKSPSPSTFPSPSRMKAAAAAAAAAAFQFSPWHRPRADNESWARWANNHQGTDACIYLVISVPRQNLLYSARELRILEKRGGKKRKISKSISNGAWAFTFQPFARRLYVCRFGNCAIRRSYDSSASSAWRIDCDRASLDDRESICRRKNERTERERGGASRTRATSS